MAKKGQRSPYRVRFDWSHGVGGTVVSHTRAEALDKAEEICAAARHREGDVIVLVWSVDAPETIIRRIDTSTEEHWAP